MTDIDSEEKLQAALAAGRPVLVDFWAEWLGPCRIAGEVFENVAKDYEGRLDFVRVDAERFTELADAHAVKSLPTVLLCSGGKELKRLTGPYPLQNLRSWLDGLLAPKQG
jgi:thioredoxin